MAPFVQTHGGSKLPEFFVWWEMKARCHNKRNKRYADYGGRGITVCPEWTNDFAAFLRDMGLRPSSGHSLDRIDNDGNYEPANCRWATAIEQNRNSRHVRAVIRSDGQFYPTMAEAAAATGAHKSSLTMACQGRLKTTAGFGWRYADG